MGSEGDFGIECYEEIEGFGVGRKMRSFFFWVK
jgi:hypothetical protein